jgi:pimeloyl-ACP methyl ester carboxylesterase
MLPHPRSVTDQRRSCEHDPIGNGQELIRLDDARQGADATLSSSAWSMFADPRIAAVITVCPLTDGLAAWLEPAPAGMVLRMVSRAVREMITRRPVTMPVAGRPGDFAVLPTPEALPGFEHVTAGRPWRNEISTSWLFPLAAFRPITAVPHITAPVLYQVAQHDGMRSAGQVDKAIPRTPTAEVKRYPMDHFGPFSPEHQPAVTADASDFLRTHLAT